MKQFISNNYPCVFPTTRWGNIDYLLVLISVQKFYAKSKPDCDLVTRLWFSYTG